EFSEVRDLRATCSENPSALVRYGIENVSSCDMEFAITDILIMFRMGQVVVFEGFVKPFMESSRDVVRLRFWLSMMICLRNR
ncbi:hypothetical protein FCV25MIE_17075, partial [Fagus crenata]